MLINIELLSFLNCTVILNCVKFEIDRTVQACFNSRQNLFVTEGQTDLECRKDVIIKYKKASRSKGLEAKKSLFMKINGRLRI